MTFAIVLGSAPYERRSEMMLFICDEVRTEAYATGANDTTEVRNATETREASRVFFMEKISW